MILFGETSELMERFPFDKITVVLNSSRFSACFPLRCLLKKHEH